MACGAVVTVVAATRYDGESRPFSDRTLNLRHNRSLVRLQMAPRLPGPRRGASATSPIALRGRSTVATVRERFGNGAPCNPRGPLHSVHGASAPRGLGEGPSS